MSDALEAMGFKPYLKKEIQGCVITTFHTPKDPNYNFESTNQSLTHHRVL